MLLCLTGQVRLCLRLVLQAFLNFPTSTHLLALNTGTGIIVNRSIEAIFGEG